MYHYIDDLVLSTGGCGLRVQPSGIPRSHLGRYGILVPVPGKWYQVWYICTYCARLLVYVRLYTVVVYTSSPAPSCVPGAYYCTYLTYCTVPRTLTVTMLNVYSPIHDTYSQHCSLPYTCSCTDKLDLVTVVYRSTGTVPLPVPVYTCRDRYGGVLMPPEPTPRPALLRLSDNITLTFR